MVNQSMPIESATITVTGDGADGTAVQIYTADGFVAGSDGALVIPAEGSFVLDIQTVAIYPFETQTLGAGCPEWVSLEDVTEGGTKPAICVKGTAPQGVDGPVSMVVNGVIDGETHTFPSATDALVLTVTEAEPDVDGDGDTQDNPVFMTEYGGPVGLGFMNKRRLRLYIDSVEYTAGGLDVPAFFVAESLVSVSARGGCMAQLDEANQRVVLYTASGEEMSGTVEALTIVLIGH